MMKYKVFDFLLLTSMFFGLGMSVASCKDDDDNKVEEQKGPDSAEGLSGTLEEDILKDLVCQWCDAQKNELTGSWTSKTYEATTGTIIDESRPGVRYIQADTQEDADAYAISALGTLGIDCMKPDGFSYSNSSVGKVSYNHSDDGMTWGVIDVDVRMIPNMEQIRLVKTMPENANGTPHYRCGDIIRYNNRFYVCTSEHKYKETARFINFNFDTGVSTGTFNWSFVGKDTVYTDNMASFETIAGWIENILLCDSIYNTVMFRMADYGSTNALGQVAPENDELRVLLAAELFKWDSHCLSVHTVNSPITRYEYYYNDNGRSNDLYVFAPNGLMLANKVRWSEGFTWDQWVPYVHCVWNKEFGSFYGKTIDDASQTTLSPSHFTWQCKQVKSHKRYDIQNNEFKQKDQYWICLSAVHWRHEALKIGQYVEGEVDMRESANGLLNFTKNYVDHPKASIRNNARKVPASWVNHNITSQEITFTDKGTANSKYQTVYVRSEDPNAQ